MQCQGAAQETRTSIQPLMKQPTDQRERKEDKKKPEENPSRGIDPETEEEEMEVVDQDPGERQKENQNKEKDDRWRRESIW